MGGWGVTALRQHLQYVAQTGLDPSASFSPRIKDDLVSVPVSAVSLAPGAQHLPDGCNMTGALRLIRAQPLCCKLPGHITVRYPVECSSTGAKYTPSPGFVVTTQEEEEGLEQYTEWKFRCAEVHCYQQLSSNIQTLC